MKIPHDAERLMDELPQDVLNEIQLELVIFSGLSLLKWDRRNLQRSRLKSI